MMPMTECCGRAEGGRPVEPRSINRERDGRGRDADRHRRPDGRQRTNDGRWDETNPRHIQWTSRATAVSLRHTGEWKSLFTITGRYEFKKKYTIYDNEIYRRNVRTLYVQWLNNNKLTVQPDMMTLRQHRSQISDPVVKTVSKNCNIFTSQYLGTR